MRNYVIAFIFLFIAYIISSNAMPNFLNNLTKEQAEAYEACNRLRVKAPYLNLKCEKLRETSKKIGEKSNMKGVKLLTRNDANTRKVNKSQEIKLRKLMLKLTSENVLKKD